VQLIARAKAASARLDLAVADLGQTQLKNIAETELQNGDADHE
jgi:hypothetical protein